MSVVGRTLLFSLALPSLAAAQVKPAPAPAAAPAPRLGAVDASRLTPGRWSYGQSVTMGTQHQEIGRRTLTLSAVRYKGAPAWLIVDEIEAQGARTVDSLYAAKSDLAPLHREMSATMGQQSARLVNDFREDSVTGAVIQRGTTVPIAAPNRPGLLASSGQLELLLQLLPLRAGWRASAEVFAPGAGVTAVPVEIALTGEEKLATAGGTVDSWTASVRGQAGEQKLWIDKATRRVLKVASTTPMAPGAVIEMVLVPASAPPR